MRHSYQKIVPSERLEESTHGTLLAVRARVSDIVLLVAVTAAADAVAAAAADLAIARHACAVGLFAVARLAAPSRQAIASAAFTLPSVAANLKHERDQQMGRNNRIHASRCNVSSVLLEKTVRVSLKGK